LATAFGLIPDLRQRVPERLANDRPAELFGCPNAGSRTQQGVHRRHVTPGVGGVVESGGGLRSR